jgi:hypothetical protein
MFKNNNRPTDWAKYLGIKQTSQQLKISNELFKQVEQNGIYALFDKSNSKHEIEKRLTAREDRKHRIAEFRFKRIAFVVSVLFAVIAGVFKLFYQ